MDVIGRSVIRKEANDKVTGRARYTNDYQSVPMLWARLVISPYAHSRSIE